MSQTPDYHTRNRRTQRTAALYSAEQRPARERQPVGISQELKDRQANQQRYFNQKPDIYDDLSYRRIDAETEPRKPHPQRRKKHTGIWALVTLICWMFIGVIVLFVSPQLFGV